jgi:hypothetical protein
MKLKALRALRYAGKSVLKGGVFECKAGDVRLLVGAKIAENYVEPVARKPVTKSIPTVAPTISAPPASFEEMVIAGTAKLPAEDDAPKRAYKRKDLVAE